MKLSLSNSSKISLLSAEGAGAGVVGLLIITGALVVVRRVVGLVVGLVVVVEALVVLLVVLLGALVVL